MGRFAQELIAFFALLLALAVPAMAEPVPNYVGSQTCKSCHSDAFEAWQTSHHAKAWMLPDETTVAGNFDNVTFDHRGRRTRFFRDGDAFLIETADTVGGPVTFAVKGVGGVAPLQQYLIETEPGRLQPFDVAWDLEKKIWYHLYPDQQLPPDDAFHWSGPYKNWNARCAECHATGFRKNYTAQTRSYSSTQAEIGVGCEGCHGPGEKHVTWAGDRRLSQSATGSDTSSKGLLLNLSNPSAETEIQQCAGCHARREPLQDGNPVPGTPFHDSYRLALLRDGLYHADGQILDEVYVYGSFLQSKMYDKGVRCSDCHDPHTSRLKAAGNAVCTQCHSEAGNPGFPSLVRKVYDSPDHHFHEPGSAGAQCVSCHMIERTYMGVDGRRDHSFRVPRPDLSVSIGTPNACSDCHSDKSPQWAADSLAVRFQDSTKRGPHFAEAFTRARAGTDGVEKDLLDIALHDAFPGIVRASALDLMQAGGAQNLPGTIAPLMNDPDALVRAAAVALLGKSRDPARLPLLISALEDAARSVRIAAARQLLRDPLSNASQAVQIARRSAQKDWQNSLMAKRDFPETHMAIGGTALVLRNPEAAVRAFREATTLDPQLAEGWIMQIRIHMSLGNLAAAEIALQKALLEVPGHPVLEDLRNRLEE